MVDPYTVRSVPFGLPTKKFQQKRPFHVDRSLVQTVLDAPKYTRFNYYASQKEMMPVSSIYSKKCLNKKFTPFLEHVNGGSTVPFRNKFTTPHPKSPPSHPTMEIKSNKCKKSPSPSQRPSAAPSYIGEFFFIQFSLIMVLTALDYRQKYCPRRRSSFHVAQSPPPLMVSIV